MTFGEKVKELREQKGFSQRELGERLHVTQQTIAQYEKKTESPKLSTIQKIADALEVGIYELSTDFSSFKEQIIQESAPLSAAKRHGYMDNELIRELEKNHILRELDITEDKQALLFEYNKLNHLGRQEAIKRVSELTEISKYVKKMHFPQDE